VKKFPVKFLKRFQNRTMQYIKILPRKLKVAKKENKTAKNNNKDRNC